jgi:succinoglycan biosynthesis protein ExoA
MPVYNEAAFIERSLGAVLAQLYPAQRLEVLVVDGGSTDATTALVAAIAARDKRVRLLHNPRRIQAAAMNIALDHAQGDVIVRVDGHTIIAADYVRQCVDRLRETGAQNVGGPQRFEATTPFGRAIAAAYRSPFSVPSRFTVSRRAEYVDTVYLGAWPREVFEQVGRFDESLAVNEDYEFNYRIRRAGGRIYLSPNIRSRYYGRQTPGALWRQFFRYGTWKCRVLAQHPRSVKLRHLVAPAFVAALAGGGVIGAFSRPVRRLWTLVIALYAAANAIASLREAARAGWSLMLRLPLVFAIIHLAWGSGFWSAILRRVVRGRWS